MDKRRRSLAKSITWRLIAFLVTLTAAWLFTRDVSVTLGIGIASQAVNTAVYYLHERAWESVKWGR